MTGAYNPWRQVAELTDILVVVTPLKHADAYWEPDERVILLDRQLNQAERRSCLAHELAHLEAGDTCCGHGPDADRLARRQEARADRTAAERLISLDDLVDALRWALGYEEVAEHLHVDCRTVRARLRDLTPDDKDYIERQLATQEGAA